MEFNSCLRRILLLKFLAIFGGTMKRIEEQMAFYQAYHMNPKNKMTHFLGIPLIIYAIFIPMSWFEPTFAGVSINFSHLFFLVIWLYYLRLSISFALIILLPLLALLFAANLSSELEFSISLTYFLVAFVGGWIIQLIGHVFEKRKPALVDNFFQIFIAPLFLVAEVLFMLGFKKEMEKEVLELSKKHMP